MESEEYQTMFAVEDQHWWYVGMQSITTRLIAQLYPRRSDLHILDAGCGTGAALNYLAPFGPVAGCDLSALALQFCRQRGLRRLNQASVLRLPFESNRFDLVTSFDVLYHRAASDYGQALAEFRRVLKPGGRLLLRLPAYDWLRGRHDRVIHTARRFSAAELERSLAASGFCIEKLSYANTLLFPLALAKRGFERLWPVTNSHSDIQPNPAWQDKLLAQFLVAEASWLAGHNLPFGLIVIAIGRKP